MVVADHQGKELASHYVDLSGGDQADFVNDAVENLVLPDDDDDPPCVCILDGGVNRPHPLIKPALAKEDLHTAKPEWGVSDHDSKQHGTGMAGNALYGCLTDLMKATGQIKVRHILESVKIMPPPPGKNSPPDYGRRMQDGVAMAHIQASRRKRVLCMAVTTDEYLHGGVPSLWSGAADDLCSGGYDGTPRLMFISAGNMRDEILEDAYVYHDWNTTRGGVEDPGQAWNALTVGAYTEKFDIKDRTLKSYKAIAEPGALCPTSRTSLAWPTKVQSGWPIKPDLVMEGGNYARKDKAPMSCDDLSLLTTFLGTGRLLTTTRDTSPATALAARMAAIIWSHHPNFRPETVRANGAFCEMDTRHGKAVSRQQEKPSASVPSVLRLWCPRFATCSSQCKQCRHHDLRRRASALSQGRERDQNKPHESPRVALAN